ncbi:MAG: hypothetical protein ACNA7L_08275, partial [Roseinatronobacter sp.]
RLDQFQHGARLRQARGVWAGVQTHITHAVNFALHFGFHQVLIYPDTRRVFAQRDRGTLNMRAAFISDTQR